MKITPLLEKLKNKWSEKAACVIIACIFYIFNRYTSLDKKSVPVSLNVIQDGEMLSSSHIPSSVSVTIRTSSENISKINSESISAQLDLSYITQEGSYEIPVSIDLPPNIVELDPLQVTVYPERVKVRLEKYSVKSVKVAPQSAGQVPDGYVVTGMEANPEYISIIGPRSIVQSIDTIATEGIPVDEKTQGFSQTARLVNMNRLVKIYDGEESAEVSVSIDYEDGIQEFKNLPVLIRNIPPAFECDTQRKASITLRGPRLIMNEWSPNPDTLSVDLSDIEAAGDYSIPVSVLIPQEFHLESVSVESINVRVRERPPAVVVDETLPGAVMNQIPEGQE